MKRAQIHVNADLVRALERESERHYPSETGGVLLGFANPNHDEQIKIVCQIGPGPMAAHKPFHFEPDSKWQKRWIAKTYEESDRIVTYLGDWHTHPRGSGTPSPIDRSTAKEISYCTAARVPHPLILILFGEPEAWEIAAFRRQRWKLRHAEVFRQP